MQSKGVGKFSSKQFGCKKRLYLLTVGGSTVLETLLWLLSITQNRIVKIVNCICDQQNVIMLLQN